jgi:hypothetical protein
MDTVEIQSTSSHSAICSDVVIRNGDQVRLVFRPEIVDKRKGKKDSWEDFEKKSLSSLKSGEHFQLELHAGELLPLLRDLGSLYRHHQSRGIPQGRIELVKIERQLGKLLQLSQSELNSFLGSNTGDAIETLRRVLQWLAESPDAAKRFADERAPLPELNALIGLTNLRSVLKLWHDNAGNTDEEFWQGALSKHTFVLSLLLAYPIVVIKDKAYVGGKRVNNAHGNLVDFLCRVKTSGAAVLIEIKTPHARLLGQEYRADVFPPSRDLGGAISQVLHYRESLLTEMHALTQDGSTGIIACDPRCVIIAGHAERELTTDSAKRSFERFRERLTGVTVVTFDEVFGRVRDLITLLENPATPERL